MPQAKINHEGNRTWISDVPTLAWGKSGETSFCGALSAALKPMGIDRPYADLMGDSSLAFRVRWWKADNGASWCSASPCGEFEPWIDRAATSSGVKIAFHEHMDGKTDMSTYAKEVVTNINAGRCVLVYGSKLDLSVIYGYEADGQQILLRDYYAGDKEALFSLSKTLGLIGFISPAAVPASAKERAILSMKNAVADWNEKPHVFSDGDNKGNFLLGDAAYAQWIDDLKNEKLTDAERAGLFQPSWWTFDVLNDARWQAVTYLNSIAPMFDGDAKASIEKAANEYMESAKALSSAFQNKNAFIGPWSGKEIKDWTAEIRATEIKLLTTAREHDNAAIKELAKAVGSAK